MKIVILTNLLVYQQTSGQKSKMNVLRIIYSDVSDFRGGIQGLQEIQLCLRMSWTHID